MRAQEPMTELLCLLLIFGVAGKMTMESVVPAEKASQKPQNFHQHLPHLSARCLTSSEVSLGTFEYKRRGRFKGIKKKISCKQPNRRTVYLQKNKQPLTLDFTATQNHHLQRFR